MSQAVEKNKFSEDLQAFIPHLESVFKHIDLLPSNYVQATLRVQIIESMTSRFLKSLMAESVHKVVRSSLTTDAIRNAFFVHEQNSSSGALIPRDDITPEGLLANPLLFSPSAKASVAIVGEIQTNIDRTASFKSFRVRFVALEYVNLLYQALCNCAGLWANSSGYYAPYLAVVNASMMGKSRVVSELWRKGVFLFPICLRSDVRELPDPPRTPVVADWLTRLSTSPQLAVRGPLLESTNQICLLFLHALKGLKTWIQTGLNQSAGQTVDRVELARAWAEYLAGSASVFWTEVLAAVAEHPQEQYPADVIRIMQSAPKDGVDKGGQLMREAARNLATGWTAAVARVQAEISALLASSTLKTVSAEGLDVLFSVDEAMNLEKLGFFTFRRTLKCFPTSSKKLNMFCAVLDSSSRIFKFSLVRGDDPSVRETVGDLFAPFCHVMTFDLWLNAVAQLDLIHWSFPKAPMTRDETLAVLGAVRCVLDVKLPLPEAGNTAVLAQDCSPLWWVTLEMVRRFEFNMLIGRPFFYPFFVNMLSAADAPEGSATSTIVRLAMCKLLNVKSVELRVDIKETDEIQKTNTWSDKALSVAGALLALDISPKSERASTLASSFMRPIAAISVDREAVYTLTTAEPLLALAAMRLVQSKVVTWDHVMRALLEEEFLANHTMASLRGEIAAQILLMAAWMQSVERHVRLSLSLSEGPSAAEAAANSFHVIPVFDFLDALLGR